jgi:CBS domain-containing protein
MKEFPSVTRFMATNVVTFREDTPLRKAIDTLLKKKFSGAPVVTEDNELIGMLSEVDCLKILVDNAYNIEPGRAGTVGELMSRNLHTIEPHNTIFDAAYIFVHHGFKRLPVVRNGILVGQISRVDILKAIQEIDPDQELIPDSWKVRVPVEPKFKRSQHGGNT